MNIHDVAMIFAEANLLKNLNHKNIVQIKDCFTFDDLKAYFIMEYLPGVFFKFFKTRETYKNTSLNKRGRS